MPVGEQLREGGVRETGSEREVREGGRETGTEKSRQGGTFPPLPAAVAAAAAAAAAAALSALLLLLLQPPLKPVEESKCKMEES